MRTILVTLLLAISVNANALEVLVDMTESTTPILNEILRSTDASVQENTEDITTNTTAIAAITSEVVQVVQTQTGTYAQTNTALPYDNTAPQKTEGDELFTLSVTPTVSGNYLDVDIVVLYGVTDGTGTVALFVDAGTSAVAATSGYADPNRPNIATLNYRYTTSSTSAVTFKVRGGTGTPGGFDFNGANGVGLYSNSVISSSITISEIKA